MNKQISIEQVHAREPLATRRTGWSNPIQAGAKFTYSYAALLAIPITVLLLGPERWELVGYAGALGLMAMRWVALGSPLPRTRLNLPMLVLLAMTALSFRISPEPALAIPAASKIVAGVILFFVLYDRVHSRADLWRVASAMVLPGLALAYATPFTVRWMSEKIFSGGFFYERTWTRLIEPINPNTISGALVPIVPLALSLLFAQTRWMRILGAIAMPPLLVMVVLLQSRGALLALGVGLVVFIVLSRPKLLPFVLGGLVAAGIAYLAFPSLAPGPLFDSSNPASAALSLEYRFDLWRHALPLLREVPLIGTGLAAFPIFAEARFPEILGEYRFSHVHNLFLQVALDTGVVGGVAFLAMMGTAVVAVCEAYRRNVERTLAAGLLAAFTVLIVHGMVDMIFWGTKPGILLWMMLALAAALVNFTKQGTMQAANIDLHGT